MNETSNINIAFVVIDLETTGLSYTKNEIIEIGAIRFNLDGSRNEFSRFIKPIDKVPLNIFKLTNIKEEDLKQASPAESVLSDLRDFIKDDDLVVCHNAEFDINFLNFHLNKNKLETITNNVLDTLEISKIFLPFLKRRNLSSVAEYFNINLDNAHRAIYDAEATGLAFQKLTEFVIKYVHAQEIDFLVTVAEHAYKKEKKYSFYKEISDYLPKYLTLLRDNMIKHALSRQQVKDRPFNFAHYNFIERQLDSSSPQSPAPSPLTIENVFSETGYFSKVFAQYEFREGQIEMSNAVLRAFEKEDYLLVEAGTGVGKSLAYLVPALIYSIKNKKTIAISTNTKNLQEQLLFKDLPLIMQALDIEFTAVLVKGRDNYLCKRKWQDVYESMILKKGGGLLSQSEAMGLLNLYLWIINTKTGDITENYSYAGTHHSLWKKVASEGHLCFGRKCSHFKGCYLMNVRHKAEKANLLIINHSLLFSDFQAEVSTLGEIDYIVFDEAHNLLQTASEYLGFTLSYPDINNFINSIHTVRKEHRAGMLDTIKVETIKSSISSEDKESVVKIIDGLIEYIEASKEIVEIPFKSSGDIAKALGSYNKLRIKNIDIKARWHDPLLKLQKHLKKIAGELKLVHGSLVKHESKKFHDQPLLLDFLDKTNNRLLGFIQQIDHLTEPNLDNNAFWLSCMDVNIDDYPAGIFNYAPITVNEILPDVIYRRLKSVIFTSATLSLRNTFKYFSTHMGIDLINASETQKSDNEFIQKTITEKIVPSPFDYDKQSLLINTEYLPNVADQFFIPQSRELIKSILDINRVGTLVLFTSYKDLDTMHTSLEQTCYEKDILLLAQKISGSRSGILNQFKEHGNAVLLGTSSFWEGIDVQGESLKLLIMFKLPFQPPTEPIVEALIEKLEKEGKNAFMHYNLPNCLLKMKQGIGRLIRSKTDKGVILILDNRITKKDYGKYFKAICPTRIYVTRNPEETIDLISRKLKG